MPYPLDHEDHYDAYEQHMAGKCDGEGKCPFCPEDSEDDEDLG